MKGGTVDRRITWAVSHMHRHLAQPIAIPELASRVNLSPSRFRALFSDQIGTGPSQYLQNLRLRRAGLLLGRTFLSVKEVMGLVGYNDPSHFSRDFRRFHGVSPTAMRGSGIVTPLSRQTSSVETPRHKRIRQSRARDPGKRCA